MRVTRRAIAPCRPAPEVSIGMPVYNGEEYLTEAIEAVLRQSFSDFELIVSDNASTDRTPEICAEYCRRDPRIRYIRQPYNLGAVRNWNFVVGEARGRFFQWASANDRLEPEMLRKCVDVLRRDDRVVVCYGRTLFIDDDGSPIRVYEHDLHVTDDAASARFIHVRERLLNANGQHGLMRLDVLRQTGLDRAYRAGDLVLMAELALRGHLHMLPDVLFHRRMGRGAAAERLSEAEWKTFINPAAPDMTMIRWRLHLDCLRTVVRSPIPWRERWRAIVFVAKSAYWDRRFLLTETRQAAQLTTRRVFQR